MSRTTSGESLRSVDTLTGSDEEDDLNPGRDTRPMTPPRGPRQPPPRLEDEGHEIPGSNNNPSNRGRPTNTYDRGFDGHDGNLDLSDNEEDEYESDDEDEDYQPSSSDESSDDESDDESRKRRKSAPHGEQTKRSRL